jgi:signal peptidase I
VRIVARFSEAPFGEAVWLVGREFLHSFQGGSKPTGHGCDYRTQGDESRWQKRIGLGGLHRARYRLPSGFAYIPTMPSLSAIPRQPTKPWLAGALSIVSPGLGHLYAGVWRRAAAFWFGAIALQELLGLGGLGRLPGGVWIWLAASLGYLIFTIVDAARVARHEAGRGLRPFDRWYVCLVLGIVLSFLVAQLTYHRPFRTYALTSVAMEPSLQRGDRLIASSVRGSEVPGRGEIVLFDRGNFGMVAFRVVGLPGETLEFRNNSVLIDGKPLESDWGVLRDPYRQRDYGPIRIAPGSVFLLGDNRDNSSDSRVFGTVPVSALRGRALYVYWAEDKSRIGTRLR